MASKTPRDPSPSPSRPADRKAAPRLGRPSNERFRQVFTRNLSLLLDQRPEVPREPAARAAELARVCGVTPAATRKWLTGAGWPTLEKLLELAQRYGFAPDDMLSEGPRPVVDISRLIDAQALRRAELAHLVPAPLFGDDRAALCLALDPSAISGGHEENPGAALAQWIASDHSMEPLCSAGDRVVFRVDSRWAGDGIYLVQIMPGAPLELRSLSLQADGYRLEALAQPFASRTFVAPSLAGDEAGALDGEPILRGRPICLLRAFGTLRN